MIQKCDVFELISNIRIAVDNIPNIWIGVDHMSDIRMGDIIVCKLLLVSRPHVKYVIVPFTIKTR